MKNRGKETGMRDFFRNFAFGSYEKSVIYWK